MTMYESGRKINEDLQQLFNSVPIEQFNNEQRKRIIDLMLWFGSVAKFRCRSNVAYKNFCDSVFEKIAKIEHKVIDQEKGYTRLKAEMVEQ